MNNSISLQQAVDMTSLFRAQKDTIVNPEFAGKEVLPRYETFDRAIFDAILAETGCTKIAIYSGLNSQLQLRSIIVGVNANDEDILPSANPALADGDEEIYIGEDGMTCPPYCRPASALNP